MSGYGARLKDSFYQRDVIEVAADLLNRVVVLNEDGIEVALRLTEVEAYGGLGDDPGSHAFRTRTARNEVMFGPAGHLYVYRSYGVHWCVNIVTGAPGIASAVLLRAGEVIDGTAAAFKRRTPYVQSVTERDLARGPGRLTQALAIDHSFNGESVIESERIGVFSGIDDRGDFERSPRTGVSGPGGERPWRFYLKDESTVSPYRPGKSTRRA